MFHVRTISTASGAIAVQVIRYNYRKRIVLKHIGSARKEEDIASLKAIAAQWIKKALSLQELFESDTKNETPRSLVSTDKLRNLGHRYMFIYETLTKLLEMFRLKRKDYQLLLDLVLIRIVKPASKLESFTLLSELFGVTHNRTDFYRLTQAITGLKETIEKSVITTALKHFSFDFSLVFYDVTTLYFESFKSDEDTLDEKGGIIKPGLRKPGFSKDNKSNQPQIVIGLIVTKEGFPVSFDVFEGNTFEGKTFIPSIVKFKEAHRVKTLTVVADAAMISLDNVKELLKAELSYIVGARMANLKPDQIKQVNEQLIGKRGKQEDKRDQQELSAQELQEIDKASIRIVTERGLLVCDFSQVRYRKDKHEMDKQIIKATKLLEKKEGLKRTKFLKNKGNLKTEQELNTELIEKTKLLLGIKGYYTNLTDETNETIVNHYHNLWHVEKAFRIAKSDLQTRPIYHFKRQAIEAHILICFMALAVCKYMELKTKKSTKAIIKLLMQVTDARILNTLTNEEIILRSELSTETEEILKILDLSH